MKPIKSCEVTFNNFFNCETKRTRHQNTEYVNIFCTFHECDGVLIDNQKFYLQLPLKNGFPPLYNLMIKNKQHENLRVKLKRNNLVVFNYNITNTYMDSDIYTDPDTNIDTDTVEGGTEGVFEGGNKRRLNRRNNKR